MTLLEEARELIKRYLNQHPNLSTASMAKACGMSASTARTIIQGEVKKTATENITSLLLTFLSVEEVTAILQRHAHEKMWGGVIMPFAAKHLAGEATAKLQSETSSFKWQHPDHLIYAMACLPNGVDPNWIIKSFGECIGRPRLEALLNEGIVKEMNGKIKLPSDMVYLAAMDDAQENASLHIQNWKKSEIERGGLLVHLLQNYTEQSHAEAKQLIRELLEKLAKLGKDNAQGDKVLVFTIAASLLDGEVK